MAVLFVMNTQIRSGLATVLKNRTRTAHVVTRSVSCAHIATTSNIISLSGWKLREAVTPIPRIRTFVMERAVIVLKKVPRSTSHNLMKVHGAKKNWTMRPKMRSMNHSIISSRIMMIPRH